MMKTSVVLLLAWLSSAAAAPAVVWKNGRDSQSTVHISDDVKAKDLLRNALNVESSDSSLSAVVFLVGRSQDGSESLSTLASEGKLTGVASKYESAHCIHHHVSGIESTNSIVQDASRANAGQKVMQVSLDEFSSKLTSSSEPVEMEVDENGMMSKAVKHANKRARALSEADVLVVSVPANTDPSKIDSAVVNAIDNVDTVVLAAVRSTDEVKLERGMEARRKLKAMQQAGRRVFSAKSRRLEDEGQEDGEGDNNNNNEDLSGVYYVSMTPNILAGLLFFLLFAVTTWIGVSCMGMISGQDVYVTKMPSIGREA